MENKPDFPLPFLNPERMQYESESTLEDSEVMNLLKQAPSRKAGGIDGIPYEAMKMCRRVIEPYLTYIFQACIDLRLHLDHFKNSITVVIKKPNKPSELPNSYRPIAILNTIGKLFERLITDRMKALVLKHDLLPATQFGAPGRNTTLAIEYLVDTIHRGWKCKRKVSLLGLDLSDAYDHVDRNQLLETLMSKGMPDCLVEIIWSFLSDRRSFINLPGHDGAEYWIDVGIPQGSPLSSLLFLFHAAPLLDDFINQYDGHKVMMFSYVDDTCIVISAESYEQNLALMAEIHDNLNDWATRSNLHFSPAKYHVMHFEEPSSRLEAGSSELPGLKEFRNISDEQKAKILPDKLVILGVTFDKRLTFTPHVKEVRSAPSLMTQLTFDQIGIKIRKDLANFRRFSGSTWGVNFVQRRELYYG